MAAPSSFREERFVETWTVGPADRSHPDSGEWSLSPPLAPKAPVEIWLPEPSDHALIERLVTVESSGGEPINGSATLLDGDRQWRFRPRDPWSPGAYLLRVAAALEGLAGNSLSRLFDEPFVGNRVGTPATEAVRLPFEVRAAEER